MTKESLPLAGITRMQFFSFFKKKIKEKCEESRNMTRSNIKLFFLPSVKTAKKCTLNIPLFETINYPFVR
jgi:hypothetical protein